MTPRGALALALLSLCACQPKPGSARVTVVFDGETRTQCVKAEARTASGVTVSATTPAIPRGTKDTLVIAVGETGDLTGEVFVTIDRHAAADCSDLAFGSETKSIRLLRGAATVMLEFRYSDPPTDGGVDGGLDAGMAGGFDGGADAGACDLGACANAPGECETASASGCASDGGCRFTAKLVGESCGDGGVCNGSGACVSNPCTVLATGTSCDDGVSCTPSSVCSGGVCRGGCAPTTVECKTAVLACDPATPTACLLEPTRDGTNCSQGGKCLGGECRPWVTIMSDYLKASATTVVYPDAGFVLASPDGGPCDTVISTDGPAASLTSSECGAPPLFASVDDAGVAVLTMTSLDVGANARLHFTGARPVQLIVLGDASVKGMISVAPRGPALRPAGSNPQGCNAADGASTRAAGGGGGFGATGGTGGESGGQGGTGFTSLPTQLRGGCSGGDGFRASPPFVRGGAGGGAVHLLVQGALGFGPGAIVTASAGGGAPGAANGEGGGGGGSGGFIVLEAATINLTGAAITANGGGGGEGGESGTTSDPGSPGALNTATGGTGGDNSGSTAGPGGRGGDSGSLAGANGNSTTGTKGGGGGGGSAGILFIRATGTCTLGTSVLSGAFPLGNTCT